MTAKIEAPVIDSAALESAHPGTDTEPPGQPATVPASDAESASLPHGCRCGSRWGGGNTAHCGACHHTFTTVSNFDRHRRNGECLNPRDAGLIARERPGYTAWSEPGLEKGWWKSNA